MSLIECLEAVGWTIATFLIGIVFDMVAQFNVQLSYIAPRGTPYLKPTFRIKPSVRHVVLFVVACFIQYFVRNKGQVPTTSMVVVAILLLIYGVLLVRDAVFLRKREREL